MRTAGHDRGELRWRRVIPSLAVLTILVSGCLPPDTRATGTGREDPTSAGDQSETAINVSNANGRQTITVTYNDQTDPNHLIQYTSTTRHVSAGTSMLGWSYSIDEGVHWTYGGTVKPPAEWPVLWGDPAITTEFIDQRHVWISNLAVAASKMPAAGIDGALNGYISGACIARSDDAGITFAIQQCVSRDLHFYDGGSMVAAGTSFDRRVFAAFVDVTTDKIDIWASPTPTGTFALMPDPFPGIPIFSHPRLRYDRDSEALYVAALGGNGAVQMNCFVNGSWQRPVVASYSTAGNPDIQLSDRVVRTGYQFSFDVGNTSGLTDDGVRVAYTAKDARSGRFYIRGSYCDRALTTCFDAPEWGTTPGNFRLEGDQFNPLVRNFPGFITLPAVWKLTYESREDDPGGNRISWKEGNLVAWSTGRIFVPFDLIAPQVPCPDNRGYWGDYDELQFAGFAANSEAPRFILPHSDSTQGCNTRWQYSSKELHVSTVMFD